MELVILLAVSSFPEHWPQTESPQSTSLSGHEAGIEHSQIDVSFYF